jgi:copper(I)-binding protein
MAMVMQEMTDGLPLPAGETVSLAPGGYHIMLLDLVEPLETGDEFEVTLDFENADDVTLTVTVSETAPNS